MNGERIVATLCSALIAAVLSVDSIQARQNPTTKAPDNTSVNKRDRDQSAPTADQAKNNLSDRQIMAHIRRDVVKDKKLSTYAHNVKIIAEHGKVTLKGPVHSEDERRAVEEYARKYAGEGNVTNNLNIKDRE
jgi:hyperosmotically inducible periplasmic protein